MTHLQYHTLNMLQMNECGKISTDQGTAVSGKAGSYIYMHCTHVLQLALRIVIKVTAGSLNT